MRVVLVGQKSFGAAVLSMLLEQARHGVEVVEVWAPLNGGPWDRDKLWAAAGAAKIPRQEGPEDSITARKGQVDLIIAAHSHRFLGQRTRKASTLGAIGYHPSLLPRHRGIDAVHWTVHMGDPIAGGTVYWLDNGVDTGPIARQDWCHVRPGWTASDLWRERLFPMGVQLLRQVVWDLVMGGKVVMVPQDEALATWEPSWQRPPLHRPELPELGRMPAGFELVVNSRCDQARSEAQP
jgi:methionyl-tRNA formyltransferase